MTRLAVVTGGAGGIGLATVRRLVRDDAFVIAVDSDSAGLEQLLRELSGHGAVIEARLDTVASIAAAFATIARDHGDPDILVNNVGGSARGKSTAFRDSDLTSFDKLIDLNLRSAIWASRQVIEPMCQRGWGRIVNLSSEAAFVGHLKNWDYGAAKAGVVGFTRSLAREVAATGVTVNAVGPGITRTNAYDQLLPELREAALRSVPAGRAGEPDEVAAVIAFLAGADSGYVTGQTILVNGGSWML